MLRREVMRGFFMYWRENYQFKIQGSGRARDRTQGVEVEKGERRAVHVDMQGWGRLSS